MPSEPNRLLGEVPQPQGSKQSNLSTTGLGHTSRVSSWLPQLMASVRGPLGASVAVATVVAAFAWIETRAAAEPFDGPNEDNARAFVGAARNHLRQGLSATLGQDLLPPGTGWYGDLSKERRYLHHPPGVALTLAGAIWLFGDSRATARLTAAFFHLLSLLALLWGAHRFVRSGWGAALAGALFVLTPLSAFYGRSVDHDTFALPFILWSQVLLVEHRQSDRRELRAGAIALACLGGLFSWSAWCWIAVAAVHDFVAPPNRRLRVRAALPWVAAGLATFAVVVGHIVWIAGSLHDLLGAASNRMGRPNDLGEAAQIGPLQWFARVWKNAVRALTGPLLVTAIGVGITRVVSWLRGGRRLAEGGRLTALSGLTGLAYVFGFRSGSYYHAYWLLPLLPACCWGTAVAITMLRQWRPVAGVALVVLVWWSAGPWASLWFRTCFPPYRAFGACERPVGFTGFGRLANETRALYRLKP